VKLPLAPLFNSVGSEQNGDGDGNNSYFQPGSQTLKLPPTPLRNPVGAEQNGDGGSD
jgi:hypothetical protein